MKITLDIEDDKLSAFLNFIKTLDYVTVNKENVDFKLSEEHKNILEDRKESYQKGESKGVSWDEVKSDARKKSE